MHLLRTDTRTLDEAVEPVDLAQSPAELVFLSFTDSDLALMAAVAEDGPADGPSLRIASLKQLRHPFSVDLYVGTVLRGARVVVVRLLGGLEYWRYGVEEFARAARRDGIALAIVPGDHVPDSRLADASTVPAHDLARIWRYCEAGGPDNMRACLAFMADRAGHPGAWSEPAPVRRSGLLRAACREATAPHAPRATIVVYRSAYLAGDTAPIVALADELAARGFAVRAAFVASLKDPCAATAMACELARAKPDVILNTTAFSARSGEGPGVLDRADCPVFQVMLSGSGAEAWRDSRRGLSAADLAMNVVLPELDGRIVTRAISFKAETERSERVEFTRVAHRPDRERCAFVAALAAGWARLRRTPQSERRIACILSDYPGKGGRTGYAVGLDTPASVIAIADDLREAGYAIGTLPDAGALMQRLRMDRDAPLEISWNIRPHAEVLALGEPRSTHNAGACFEAGLRPAPQHEEDGSFRPDTQDEGESAVPDGLLALADYRRLWHDLPASFRRDVEESWGRPETDPAVVDGAFRFALVRAGNLLVAVQPDRGRAEDRRDSYHDANAPPRHAYLAFYLWLRHVARIDAIVHAGTHGTLEWLPGKAVALSADCAPEIVTGPVPVIYPFIVNNPGEAAQSKRRLAAVTIGHLTPPLVEAGAHGATAEIEGLLDEYAEAQNLDPRRARRLAEVILARAGETGLAAESDILPEADPDDALARLDAWLCDIKEMRIGDGLHVFGRRSSAADRAATAALLAGASGHDPARSEALLAACAAAERSALLAALDGRFVEPGPAGAPSRGRLDVLPTGRNLYTIDPRAVPTRTAWEIGRRTADEVLTRYLQDHGEYPRRIVLDLWGSASMRTGGDELAQAMALLGVKPTWDNASTRVLGFEILAGAVLGRPRVDVTLRISGLFRDVFPTQITLFDEAVAAVAALDEDESENPLAAAVRALPAVERRAATWRIFGASPGAYGIGLAAKALGGRWDERSDLGERYLAATSHAFGASDAQAAAASSFRARVQAADAFVHVQDMAEQDVLDSDAFAEHEGGFAAAAAATGATPALLHVDTSRPGVTRVRTLSEEIARVVRGRATNPRWIGGQMRHGHRGAAEIAETVDNLFVFAATTDAVESRHFDLLFDATCGDEHVRDFLLDSNPEAAHAIAHRFEEAAGRGFWTSRRNSAAAILAGMQDVAPSLFPASGDKMARRTA